MSLLFPMLAALALCHAAQGLDEVGARGFAAVALDDDPDRQFAELQTTVTGVISGNGARSSGACGGCTTECVAVSDCNCVTCTTTKRQTIMDSTQAVVASNTATGFCTEGDCFERLCCLFLSTATQGVTCTCTESGVTRGVPCPDMRTCPGSSSSNKSLLGLLGLLGLLALLVCCFLPCLCCPRGKAKPNVFYPSYLPQAPEVVQTAAMPTVCGPELCGVPPTMSPPVAYGGSAFPPML
eukprot:450332_1